MAILIYCLVLICLSAVGAEHVALLLGASVPLAETIRNIAIPVLLVCGLLIWNRDSKEHKKQVEEYRDKIAALKRENETLRIYVGADKE